MLSLIWPCNTFCLRVLPTVFSAYYFLFGFSLLLFNLINSLAADIRNQTQLLPQCNAAAAVKSLQSCPTLKRPHGLQPTRLLRLWDCPGKSTAVGCHCLLQQCKDSISVPAGSAASEESTSYCSGGGSHRTEEASHSPSQCPMFPISLSSGSRQLRLVDGGGPCAGRVEILDHGSWGTICQGGWDLDDARVVCRQLGCGEALDAPVSSYFGAGSGPIWLDNVKCTGKESHVWRCPSEGWGKHYCDHSKEAGVICSGMVSSLPTSWENGKF